MILSDLSIRRPVFAWMMMTALLLFGAISFAGMGVSLMPDVDFPVVSINITYQGASPQIMETDVADYVEDAVMGVEGVKSVTSTSRDGNTRISVEFELNKNIDVAVQEIQSKLSQAQRLLPKDIDPPIITKTNQEDQPIIWLTLSTTDIPTRDAMAYVRDILKNKFSTVTGVGSVVFGGYVDPNLRVEVRKPDLNRYALTVSDVVSAVQNEHVELPAGFVQDEKAEHTVRTLGEAKTVKEFENIRLNYRGGSPNYSPVQLIKVASIKDGLADIDHLARANGVSSVGLGILKQRGTNAVEVAKAIRIRLAEVKKELPKGMEVSIRMDSTKFIKDAVNELKVTLVLSAILTGLVCWLFLGSWSAVFNVWLAIPTSIVGTFIFIYFMGFTLNTFTLMALSLSIGIVVDDAIMVLENIMRHQEKGEKRVDAALKGAREITFAAMASSIAIVAIFLPVAFMKGIIGKYFYQFGMTLSVAVMLSLFEALTLTPMRCSQFVSAGARENRFSAYIDMNFKRLNGAYRKALSWSLQRRGLIIWSSVIFFVLTFSVSKALRSELVPPQDQSLYNIRLQTPAWASLAFTDEKSRLAEAIVSKRPEVDSVFAAVGGFGSGGRPNQSYLFITLKPKGKRGIDKKLHHRLTQEESMKEVRKELKNIPDLKASMVDPSLTGFASTGNFPIELTLRGPDWDKLGIITNDLMKEIEKTGLTNDLNTNYLLGMTEYDILPDRELASSRGVSFVAIGQTLSTLVGGLKVGTYEKGGHRYDISVKMTGTRHTKADILKDIYVRNNRGELISLKKVTYIQETPAMQSIFRQDRERATTITANIVQGRSQAEVLAKIEQIAKAKLPEGYRIVFSGNAKAYKESFDSLIFALVLGIIIAYMVLGSQFNSFSDPVVVLAALPFSVSGAFLALYVTGQSLNIYSMIGFILLMGIVKKNSILLVEFTNQIRDTGMPVREALLEACPIRLRPILMTTIATIAGAIPPALAWGPGAEIRTPMAIAVIGGLLISTLLTLFVVPCAYSLINNKN
jgi:hydrophobe/amphiphile efflux-1 (HAE1) family protein